MAMLSRRNFLIAGASLAAMSASPSRLLAVASETSRPALPIPPELRADGNGAIALEARLGSTVFGPGGATATYGYNGSFLGPALRVRRGETATIDFTNRLAEPTSVHWHGLVVPGDVDGGPHNAVAPGARHRADHQGRILRDPGAIPPSGRRCGALHGALSYPRTRGFRDDDAVHGRLNAFSQPGLTEEDGESAAIQANAFQPFRP